MRRFPVIIIAAFSCLFLFGTVQAFAACLFWDTTGLSDDAIEFRVLLVQTILKTNECVNDQYTDEEIDAEFATMVGKEECVMEQMLALCEDTGGAYETQCEGTLDPEGCDFCFETMKMANDLCDIPPCGQILEPGADKTRWVLAGVTAMLPLGFFGLYSLRTRRRKG